MLLMRKMRWGALLGAFLVLGACAGGDDTAEQTAADTAAAATEAPASPAPSNVQLPEGVTPEMVAQGQEIFNTNICWSCHQQNAVGGPLAPALNDTTWINVDGSYDAIIGVIKSGVAHPTRYDSPMPAMGGAQLTEDQIRSLAAYVYSISHGG
jgi:mono/diheme cytochrome c family protein